MKVWVYESRRGEIRIFAEHNRHLARAEQDDDNRCTVEDILADNELEVDGNPDEGDFSIDDGGSITLMEVI
jgi:hypothetical protein